MAVWSLGTSLRGQKGDAGVNGSKLIYGAAEPGLTLGAVGDFFYRTDTQAFYVKITFESGSVTPDYPNGWRNLGSVKGLKGDTGSIGPAGATGPAGPKGDTGAASTVPGPKGDMGTMGLSVLSGSGAPSNDLGVDGQPAYIDTLNALIYAAKASGTWPQGTSIKGPKGDQGPIGPAGAPTDVTLGLSTAAYGPIAALTATTLSATPTNMLGAGTTQISYHVPSIASAYVGGSLFVNYGSSAGTVGFELWDQTASKSIYKFSLAAGTITSDAVFGSLTYPMTQGNVHVWRVTGSGSNSCLVVPQYLMASSSPSGTTIYPLGVASNVALSATATGMQPYVGATGQAHYYRNGRIAFAQFVYINVTGTGTVTSLNLGPLTVTGTWPAGFYTVGPLPLSQGYLPAATQYNPTVKGTGTVTVSANMLLVM